MGIISNTLVKKTAKNVLIDSFKLKKKERLLVVCEKKMLAIAKAFSEAGEKICDNVKLMQIKDIKVNGQEPEKTIGLEMEKSDVVLLVTNKSLSHTNARKKASKKGARIASMPGITAEMMQRAVNIDFGKIRVLSKKIGKMLRKGKELRITTKLGTRFFCKINQKAVVEDNGKLDKKGSFDNLPCGEVFFPPVEGTSFGRYVVDLSQAGVGKLRGKIMVKVGKGFATYIEGKKEAKILDSILKKVKDKNAYNIAEIGIGTNYRAKITGNVLEDEKVIGTCHIALGNNYSFGGKVNVPIHLDGVIDKPTILVDDKLLMKDGKFVI